MLPLEPAAADQYNRKPPTNCRATKPPKVRCAGGATPVGVDCQLDLPRERIENSTAGQ